MFFVIMLALWVLAAYISARHKEASPECLAIVTAALILVMYLLAFFRGLKLLWIPAGMAIIYVAAMAARGRKDFCLLLLKKMFDPGIVMFGIAVLLVGLATSGQIFTWWDDINFWSSDAKQLFFLNGFPGKYGNVSPEFGDYPPVTSLVKWLFLQVSEGEYRESLQFVGYFFLNGVFLLPLYDRFAGLIKKSGAGRVIKTLAYIVSFAAVMLLPGIFNGIIYYGTPADISMAIVYGSLLLAMADDGPDGDVLYFIRIALYAAVLVLIKSVGFEWAAFALIFYALFGRRKKTILIPVIFSGTALASWLGFCFINRRVAKLTGAGLKMATSGNYRAPDNTVDKLRYFFEGFSLQPMHADHNLTFDLSTGAAVLLIFLVVFVLCGSGVFGKKEGRKLAAFLLISAAVSYGIVFVAHITIFQTEDQYLDAYAMAVSIARYCAPFTLGSVYLIMGVLLERMNPSKNMRGAAAALLGCLLFVLLTADYRGVYGYLHGYRGDLEQNEAYVRDMVGDDGRVIVAAVDDAAYRGKRVLVLRDGHEYYWVHNTYISKEASPVALVYDTYLVGDDTPDSIRNKLSESHASYFYVEDESGASRTLFSEVVKNGRFEPGKVIEIEGNVN